MSLLTLCFWVNPPPLGILNMIFFLFEKIGEVEVVIGLMAKLQVNLKGESIPFYRS